jgi:broad specificity phosphatase PhoE
MPIVYLIRHGQASFGGSDYDVLSDRGRAQALLLGRYLRDHDVQIDRAESGTLRRQVDTAATSLTVCAPEIEFRQDARWNEFSTDDLFAQQGHQNVSMAGADPREYRQSLEEAIGSWIAGGGAGAGGETWAEFDGRLWAALEDVLAELGSGQAAAVFTSGGAISAVVARLLNLPAASYIALHRVSVNAAVTKIVSGRSGISLLSFNEHGYLAGQGRDMITHT